MIEYGIRIDLETGRSLDKSREIVFTTGDVMAYRLKFVFWNDGVLYDATDCSLLLKGLRADGAVIADQGEIAPDGSAYYDVKSAMYTTAGMLRLEVALVTQTGSYVTTKELLLGVRAGHGDGELAEEDVTPLLTELGTKLDAAATVTERATLAAEAAEEAASGETVRVSNETERIANEQTRQAEESLRVTAESARTVAEVGRWEAESGRVEAEQTRDTQESLRQEAETTRVLSENERLSAEAIRLQEEADRKAAETARELAETVRNQQEAVREEVKLVAEAATASAIQATEQANAAAEAAGFGLYANALRATKSGVFVRMEDVSPVVHDVEATVRNEDATSNVDFSTVALMQYGKNLLDINNTRVSTGVATVETSDGGTIRITNISTGRCSLFWRIGKYRDFVGKTLTLTIKLDDVTDGAQYTLFNTFYRGADVNGNLVGSEVTLGNTSVSQQKHFTFTVAENETAEYLELRSYVGYMSNTVGYLATITGLQLEVGETATKYEDYVAPVSYTPLADGTVAGVKSISPTMTLLPNKTGVTIDCVYNRDTNKVIEQLTNAIISLGGNV